MIPLMTYPQYRTVQRLVHSCCNYDRGNCLLLDDGEECVCPQAISYSLICRWFRAAVLPLDGELYTYQFIEVINLWLVEHGMPQITVVQNVDRFGNRFSLETECLRSHTLPSIAYGHKRCSQKHKIGPQEKFCNHYLPCREVWQRGGKVNRFIGYDAGEVKRYEHSRKYNEADKKYHNRYPLIEEWGWNRNDCIREIKAAGLPQPGKSSCFFCPSMKRQEILTLKEHYPDLFNRAVALEENAMPYLKTVKGLGRSYSWKEQFGKE